MPGGSQQRGSHGLSIGQSIGSAAGEFWRGLGEALRVTRDRESSAVRQRPQVTPRHQVPLRASGVVLIGAFALAWFLFLNSRPRNASLDPSALLFSPFSAGIAISALWALPTAWGRLPWIIQKVLLFALLVIAPIPYMAITTSPLCQNLVSGIGLSETAQGRLFFGVLVVGWVATSVMVGKRLNPRVAAG